MCDIRTRKRWWENPELIDHSWRCYDREHTSRLAAADTDTARDIFISVWGGAAASTGTTSLASLPSPPFLPSSNKLLQDTKLGATIFRNADSFMKDWGTSNHCSSIHLFYIRQYPRDACVYFLTSQSCQWRHDGDRGGWCRQQQSRQWRHGGGWWRQHAAIINKLCVVSAVDGRIVRTITHCIHVFR